MVPGWRGRIEIELRAVSKDYNGQRVIDSISVKVETGERVVLFGPSGCGKSTVLQLIAGLTLPDSGEILIDGELVATAHRNLRGPEKRGIGMVFQDLALWPHMTVAAAAQRDPTIARRLEIYAALRDTQR